MPHEIPQELSSLFRPQIEQFGVRLSEAGDGWGATAAGPRGEVRVWVASPLPGCLVTDHDVTPAEDVVLLEEPETDYACVVLASEDTARAMPDMVSSPHALLDGSLFSFVQGAGTVRAELLAGRTYSSRSISLLPGFFAELERSWPGEYAGVFERFDTRWDEPASRAIMAALLGVAPRAGAGSGLLARASVERMAAALARSCAERARAEKDGDEAALLVRRMRAYVDAHLDADLSTHALARALYVSRSRLCAAVRACGGAGVASCVRAARLERARELLATTELPVAEVARLVGYPRATSFSATFAREVGESPTAWRARRR